MTLKEEPVFDKKNRFYLRNGKNDVTAISAPTEKQAMVVGATGDTTLVRVRKQTCRIRPQCLAICVFLVVVVLIIIGLIVGLATREPRKRKSQQNPFLRTTPVHEDIYPTSLTPTHVPGEYRLPVDVLPVHYTVHLHPVLGPETFYFTGNVTIKFRVVNFTEKLILHALLDEIGNMSLVSYPSLSHVPIIHTEKVKRLNFLEVHIGDGGVHPGDVYVFSCTFRNKLLTNFIGIYYDTYHDAAGAQKYFLASQLESIFARRIFPCFDEPGFKANFTISITHQHHHVAITNMPKTHSTNTSTGEVTSHFQTSVRMPTYLLAFAVGEFQSVDILNDVDIQQQRIWMQNSEYLRRSIYAQTLISDQLTYFQNYFNISYSLPKLDHIGIPAKGKGAMENWGLITYGEGYLVTEVASPPQEKIDAASVIAHELSHQWFGNLVTMQWWDDLWLNEGFARCMEYVGVDSVHPDWDYWDLFLYQTLNPALSLDGLRSSREIRAHTETPSDISANFDVITYLKGGSVVRMLINFLGWDVFRVGISTYLKEYSFRNTVSNDLWRILTEVSYAAGLELDVESIMHTWTLQKNYPLVTVSRDYEHRTMQLLQTRFLLDTSPDHVSYSANETTSLFDYTWDIPFTYTDATQQSYSQPSRQWMFRENLTVTNLATPSTEWIIGNINATGFYRVNYDVTNWRLLITQLQENHQLFTPTSRAQMVDDALYLARAGLLNQSIALETTLYLSRETHMAPWVTLEVFWELFYKILSQTRAYGAYKNYMLSLLAPIYDELGWRDSGDDMERLLRSKIVTLSCQFGYQPCVQQAVNSFTRWVEDPNQFISAPLRTAVLCTGIAQGGVAEWDILWDRMQETQDPTIRDAYRDALACSNQPWLLSRYLSQALNRTLIHPHEVAWVVMATARNPIGKHQAWTFVKENWSNTGSTMLYGKTFLAEKAMDSFFTAEDVEDMLTFRSQYKDHHGYAFRYVDAAVERTHANHRWINQNLDEMNNWFIANT